MTLSARTILQCVFWSVVAYFVVVRLFPEARRLELSREFAQVDLASVLPAVPLVIAHYLAVFLVWILLLRALGANSPFDRLFQVYVLSIFPKYLPGRIIAPGVRLRLARNAGVPLEAATSSMVAELALSLASVALVSILGLHFGGAELLEGPARFIVVTTALLVLLTLVAVSAKQFGTKWHAWVGVAVIRQRPGVVGVALALFGMGWLLSGIAHLALFRAVSPLAVPPLPSLIVAVAVSWGVGLLSVFTPAGLGVREGVLLIFAGKWMSPGEAVVFVTLSRLLSLSVEGLLMAFLGLGTLWQRAVALARSRSPRR